MLSVESVFLLAGVVMAAALIMTQLWRRAEARAADLEADLAKTRANADRLGAELTKESRARRRLSEELAGLRKRADKTKRRQQKTEDQPLGTSARIRDHEAEVERIRLELGRSESERDTLAQSVAALERDLAVSASALAQANAPRPEPVATPAEEALDESRGELASTLERLSKMQNELELARQTEARMRKKMGTQEVLYASMRAELDVKKDRLRTQEEQLQRLQALKVTVID